MGIRLVKMGIRLVKMGSRLVGTGADSPSEIFPLKAGRLKYKAPPAFWLSPSMRFSPSTPAPIRAEAQVDAGISQKNLSLGSGHLI